MSRREWLAAVLFFLAAAAIAAGAWSLSRAAGLMVAGVLLAGWTVLVVVDVKEKRK